MPMTNQNGIFCCCRGKIDFENLLLLEKPAWKPFTRTKYFWQWLGGVGNLQSFSKLGGANKLKWVEKIENSVIDPPTSRDGRVIIKDPKAL